MQNAEPARATGMATGIGLIILLAAWTGDPGPAQDLCASGLANRSAREVLADHRSALAAEDWEAVQCNYGDNAVVITDEGLVQGADAITGALQQLATVFGGSIPTVDDESVAPLPEGGELVRLLFHIATECLAIEDGVDTYLIRQGRIVGQTVHGVPSPSCPTTSAPRPR